MHLIVLTAAHKVLSSTLIVSLANLAIRFETHCEKAGLPPGYGKCQLALTQRAPGEVHVVLTVCCSLLWFHQIEPGWLVAGLNAYQLVDLVLTACSVRNGLNQPTLAVTT